MIDVTKVNQREFYLKIVLAQQIFRFDMCAVLRSDGAAACCAGFAVAVHEK